MSASRYRLIAIDLDGTLLCPKGTVTPRTRAAIQRAKDAGFQICFATGRSWRESRLILEDAGHQESAVFVTGAMVVDTRRRLTLHRRLMVPQLARDISHFFESRGQAALALQDSPQADVDYLVTHGAELNAATHQWLKMTRTVVQQRSDLATAPHDETVRISIVADRAAVEQCQVGLAEEFGAKVVFLSLVLPSSGLRVLEVFDPAVNKWAGILHVAARHGISPDQIVAVGDDVNDVPMITQAGLGVAMGNAHATIQEKAHKVIGRNADEGLAVFLEELVETK